MKLYKNDRILFLGDSITDNNREYGDDSSLGLGYPLLTSAFLSSQYPKGNFTFFNRGINGHRIDDILNRLEKDCLDLKPDVLVFLIGINDTWHNLENESFGTAEEAERFKKAYRRFLERVTQAGVQRILILEPFVLPCPQERMHWRKDLDQKIVGIRYLASEFGCEYIPLDGIFAERIITTTPSYYAEDGVHPTIAGDGVIAQEILNRCEYISE